MKLPAGLAYQKLLASVVASETYIMHGKKEESHDALEKLLTACVKNLINSHVRKGI